MLLRHVFLDAEDGGLGTPPAYLKAAAGNAASQHVAIANGFTECGRERQAMLKRDGSTQDMVVFDLLADEWQAGSHDRPERRDADCDGDVTLRAPTRRRRALAELLNDPETVELARHAVPGHACERRARHDGSLGQRDAASDVLAIERIGRRRRRRVSPGRRTRDQRARRSRLEFAIHPACRGGVSRRGPAAAASTGRSRSSALPRSPGAARSATTRRGGSRGASASRFAAHRCRRRSTSAASRRMPGSRRSAATTRASRRRPGCTGRGSRSTTS